MFKFIVWVVSGLEDLFGKFSLYESIEEEIHLKAPVDTPGNWVQRESFDGKFSLYESIEEEIDLKAPVDTPGKWVQRESFDGNKSFGYFKCSKCSKDWYSAHSFPQFKQGCKKCEKKEYPLYLWKNSRKKNYNSQERLQTNDKPHDNWRCGACKAGMCGKSYYN